MPEAALRRALGRIVAGFGGLHLLPVAFVWLSSGGPSPVLITARAWSVFFYAHFLGLVTVGVGLQAASALKTRLFHGGPLIDFLIVVAAFMILETAVGLNLKGGTSWPALLPGAALVIAGIRLGTTAPLLAGR